MKSVRRVREERVQVSEVIMHGERRAEKRSSAVEFSSIRRTLELFKVLERRRADLQNAAARENEGSGV